ncbi:ATP-grasp domain-containing protein [Oleiharenicola lentus]|uniref:ATP-grasp domain-containing protein n=1 Tax=Oleiharenicola lentus TaxID=2508720 RepID=UPI003F6653CB
MSTRTILCLASFHKGHEFMKAAKAEGWNVLLLTSKSLEGSDWPAEVDEIFYMPDVGKVWNRDDVIKGVSYLARHRQLDRIVALDDFDVETAAALREHLRVPGMGDTTARYFRDKLAMRLKAREAGLPVPDFAPVVNHGLVAEFMRQKPGPWLLKPRFSASALGIKKIERSENLWPALEALGDQQSFHLLETFVPGRVYHVDSLISRGEVVFSIACRYGAPPLAVMHGGGIFSSAVCEYGSAEERALVAANAAVLKAMGHFRGASHTEFIRANDGTFHFLETSARVGGANIMDLIEAATGLNLWREWAKVELREDYYRVPEYRKDYAGLLVSLARQEWPDLNSFSEPEVVLRIPKRHHVALVWRSPSHARVEQLQADYLARVQRDFHASAPAPDKATD